MFNWIKKNFLRWAAHKGHIKTARLLIKLGADIDNILSTDLQADDYSNRIEILKSILNKGVGAKSKGKALLFAAANGHEDIIQLLLNKRVDAKYVEEALKSAIYFGHKEIAELLLEKGVDIKYIEEALADADAFNREGIIQLISDTEVGKSYIGRILVSAASLGHKEAVELLLNRGVDAGHIGKALRNAAYGGYKDIVERLLKEEVSASNKGKALCNAAISNNKEILGLFKGNIDSDTKEEVLYRSSMEVLELLFKEGVINEEDIKNYGAKLLFLAVYDYNIENNGYKAVWLLKRKVDVNFKDNDGETVLHCAARTGRQKIVELLLEKGADVNARDNDGKTALDLAKDKGYTEIVELLSNHKIGTKNSDKLSTSRLGEASVESVDQSQHAMN
ncbi:MAG: hypothetical protein sL5_03610 [Candidatus Mesenet longicola]|uniref:Ankyrin repeat domain-containing protein n=1 Tax=Candidatus Mesenet longicola TaxID=1892558 RepID=A0A8J3HPN6_9RICK|nr:MAG: hypothetical protein sGL2_09130 [Candidatus Mesenet longicola]GHM59368.1 MAG: hypothetical protein sL5_03610 [Candidatus Mesenet longicola]